MNQLIKYLLNFNQGVVPQTKPWAKTATSMGKAYCPPQEKNKTVHRISTRAVFTVMWIYGSVQEGKAEGLSCLEVAGNKHRIT